MQRIKVFINYRLFLACIFWWTCISFHKKLSLDTYNLGLGINLLNEKPLYDIIQVNLPNIQKYRFIPELLMLMPVLTLASLIIYHSNSSSVDALKTFLVKHGVLMLIRCVLFSVTLLPDSSQMCAISVHSGSCFDLIYSGHTTIMYLTTFITKEYFDISKSYYTFLHINNLITSLFIIICRNHYTVDILLSMLITYLFYHYR